jgi:hypothetical protein
MDKRFEQVDKRLSLFSNSFPSNNFYIKRRPSDMDEVLHQMHLGFNELIIQAFILDALFHHNCSIETVSERILRDLPEEHRIAVEEFEQPFQDALKKQIKVLKSTYNVFMDQQTGAIREAALRLSDDLTSWLRNLGEYGVYADEIPEEGMEQLLHFTREIDSILLETMEPVVLPEERKENTLDYLKELRLQQEKLLDTLLFPEYLPSVYTDKMIVCLAGKGNSPPENCGGLSGFRNMIDSGMTPWGDPYEPEIFDPEELTRILKERDTEKTFRSAGE